MPARAGRQRLPPPDAVAVEVDGRPVVLVQRGRPVDAVVRELAEQPHQLRALRPPASGSSPRCGRASPCRACR
eukprot:7388014-Prymnesium_polylepis.1